LSITLAALLASAVIAAQPASSASDLDRIKFILQSQAGLAAYAQITSSINLVNVHPAFLKIDIETPDLILGDYQLSGFQPGEALKLIVHRAGWALAYFPRSFVASRAFDCGAYPYTTNPGYMPNRPELSILQLAQSLNVSSTTLAYYDFRAPQDDHLVLHWVLQRGTGTITSAINPSLGNTYHERSYAFCSITPYNQYTLNGQQLEQCGSISSAQFRYAALSDVQLRPGFTNTLAVNQNLVFFYTIGVVGGVTMEYSGTAPISTDRGYRRDMALAYPPMLGDPLELAQTYLPTVRR